MMTKIVEKRKNIGENLIKTAEKLKKKRILALVIKNNTKNNHKSPINKRKVGFGGHILAYFVGPTDE
jgi:hypothetical protein